MRWVCLLLLLANLACLGWALDQRAREQVRYQSAALDVPEGTPRLRLVSELEQPPLRRIVAPSALPEGESDADEAEANDSAGADVPVDRSGPPAAESPGLIAALPGIDATLPESLLMLTQLETNACFSFGPFTRRDRAEGLLHWLHARQARSRLRHEADDPALFWIYLEPRSEAEARTTVAALREQGVQDIRLMSRGELENAISLGLFSTQAAVNRRLRELEDKGYRPVVVPYDQGEAVYWVDARIHQGRLIEELATAYPQGLNFAPIDCAEIARLRPDQ